MGFSPGSVSGLQLKELTLYVPFNIFSVMPGTFPGLNQYQAEGEVSLHSASAEVRTSWVLKLSTLSLSPSAPLTEYFLSGSFAILDSMATSVVCWYILQTVWTQIRPNSRHFVAPDPDPNCLTLLRYFWQTFSERWTLKKKSADDKNMKGKEFSDNTDWRSEVSAITFHKFQVCFETPFDKHFLSYEIKILKVDCVVYCISLGYAT